MLIVLEMAPVMNGWAAAIMRMCDSADRNRWPSLAALVGAVEDRVVLRLQVRRPFDGHGAADVGVGLGDLLAAEAEGGKQVEAGRLQLFLREAELVAAETSSPRVQRLKTNGSSKAAGSCASIRCDSSSVKPLALRLPG